MPDSDWLKQFDRYTSNARVKPALLVALPLGVVGLIWYPSERAIWGILGGFCIWAGGGALVAQLARDLGKRKEPALWASWGGTPTIQRLRFRGSVNRTLVSSRHARLQALLADAILPDESEELADPETADEVYERCSVFLRTKTRDREKYPLVFEENCNYGFRRNLWGMKSLGVSFSAIGTLAITVKLAADWLQGRMWQPSPLNLAGLGVNVLLTLLWLLWINKAWVRVAAEAYADQLLAACDKL